MRKHRTICSLAGQVEKKHHHPLIAKGGVVHLRTRPRVSAAIQRLSKKGRRVDALALRAEERRDKLRKATGSRKQAGIRGYLNGGTRLALPVTV